MIWIDLIKYCKPLIQEIDKLIQEIDKLNNGAHSLGDHFRVHTHTSFDPDEVTTLDQKGMTD